MAGAHRWQKLCQHLPEDNSCHVVAPPPTVPVGEFDRTYRPVERDEVDGLSVTRLWTYQPTDDWSSLGRMLNYSLFAVHATLYILLNFWRFDIVVTVAGPHTTLFPGLVAKLLGRAWVIDIDDLWLDNAVDMGFVNESDVSYRILAAIERISFSWSDKIITITPTLGRQYSEKHKIEESRFTEIPYGIDSEMFSPDAASEPNDRIIYTGKLGQAQAFEPFLEGYAKVDSEHQLLVVGFGERRDELGQLSRDLEIDDDVTIRDAVPREEIPELVASSTLSWVPLKTDYSLDYARPTKLVETMAVGTPYVASQVSEIESVTEASRAGLVVPNDPNETASAMRTIIENGDGRNEMGARGVEFVQEHHDWESLGTKVGNVLAEAVNPERLDD